MKNLCLVAVAAVALTCCSSVHAQQGPQAKTGAGIVAVLDLTKVFNQHPVHKSKMDQLQKQFETLKAGFQEQQRTLQAKARNAGKTFKGEELRSQELSLEQQNTTIKTKARQAQADLLKNEAKIYFETYQEVMGIVQKLCAKHNIALVLRYDSQPIDPSKPATVIRGVQRSVVYSSADLTDLVLEQTGGKVSTAQGQTQPRRQ